MTQIIAMFEEVLYKYTNRYIFISLILNIPYMCGHRATNSYFIEHQEHHPSVCHLKFKTYLPNLSSRKIALKWDIMQLYSLCYSLLLLIKVLILNFCLFFCTHAFSTLLYYTTVTTVNTVTTVTSVS